MKNFVKTYGLGIACWLLVPATPLGYAYGPDVLALLDFDPPVPENQAMVETELKKIYGSKLKTITVSNKEMLKPNMDLDDSIYRRIPFEVPENGTIVGYQFLTNAEHQVHHFNFYDENYQHPFCESSFQIIYAVGMEMSPTWYLDGHGYRVEKGQELEGEIMWLNETDKGINAKMKLKVFYVEDELEPVIPALIGADSKCYSLWFPVSGDFEMNSIEMGTEIDIEKDYEVMTLGGHCHEHCKYVGLLLNGSMVEKFLPEYPDDDVNTGHDHHDHPIRIIPRVSGLELNKGDKIGVGVSYEESHYQADGMAHIMLILKEI